MAPESIVDMFLYKFIGFPHLGKLDEKPLAGSILCLKDNYYSDEFLDSLAGRGGYFSSWLSENHYFEQIFDIGEGTNDLEILFETGVFSDHRQSLAYLKGLLDLTYSGKPHNETFIEKIIGTIEQESILIQSYWMEDATSFKLEDAGKLGQIQDGIHALWYLKQVDQNGNYWFPFFRPTQVRSETFLELESELHTKVNELIDAKYSGKLDNDFMEEYKNFCVDVSEKLAKDDIFEDLRLRSVYALLPMFWLLRGIGIAQDFTQPDILQINTRGASNELLKDYIVINVPGEESVLIGKKIATYQDIENISASSSNDYLFDEGIRRHKNEIFINSPISLFTWDEMQDEFLSRGAMLPTPKQYAQFMSSLFRASEGEMTLYDGLGKKINQNEAKNILNQNLNHNLYGEYLNAAFMGQINKPPNTMLTDTVWGERRVSLKGALFDKKIGTVNNLKRDVVEYSKEYHDFAGWWKNQERSREGSFEHWLNNTHANSGLLSDEYDKNEDEFGFMYIPPRKGHVGIVYPPNKFYVGGILDLASLPDSRKSGAGARLVLPMDFF
jgi:hypothetical protein